MRYLNQTSPTIYIYSCYKLKGIYFDQQSELHHIDNLSETFDALKIDLLVIIANNDKCIDQFRDKDIKTIMLKSVTYIDNECLNKLSQLALFEQIKKDFSYRKLVSFQSINKYLFMTYHQHILKEMGRLIANKEQLANEIIQLKYEEKLDQLFALTPTNQNRENTLTHMYGYFKKNITHSDKETYFKHIEQYRKNQISYQEILDSLYALTKTYNEPYLLEQTIFHTYSFTRNKIVKEIEKTFK